VYIWLLTNFVLTLHRAEALQSIVKLMAEKELYEYYQETYKTHSIEWTKDKAKAVLQAWQRKFTQVKTHQQNLF